MRRSVFASLMLLVVVSPAPATADHDPTDDYDSVQLGLTTLYVDDGFVPRVYMESNTVEGMQRASDGNSHGHPGHTNPDQRLF